MKMEDTQEKTGRSWIEISECNLRHNVETLQSIVPKNSKLMAVVKAQAYGHGACETARLLNQMGIASFAVATVDEGILLRKCGICGEILILGYTDVRRAPQLAAYDLMQTVIDFPYAQALNRQNAAVKVHIKVDTGMHRLGIPVKDFETIEHVFLMKQLKVCGLYTHLCCADSRRMADVAFTRKQIADFFGFVGGLRKRGISVPKLHVQSSYGLLNYPQLSCDYVRAGIALYGAIPSDADTVLKPDLRPVLSLKSRVALIRVVKKGESVGYDRRFTAARDSRIAILPIGYGDGVPRSLSEQNGFVLLDEYAAPMVGRVCMDQLAVDITDVKNVETGDVATIIGAQGKNDLSAAAVARAVGSIPNELLCRMGERLPIVVV